MSEDPSPRPTMTTISPYPMPPTHAQPLPGAPAGGAAHSAPGSEAQHALLGYQNLIASGQAAAAAATGLAGQPSSISTHMMTSAGTLAGGMKPAGVGQSSATPGQAFGMPSTPALASPPGSLTGAKGSLYTAFTAGGPGSTSASNPTPLSNVPPMPSIPSMPSVPAPVPPPMPASVSSSSSVRLPTPMQPQHQQQPIYPYQPTHAQQQQQQYDAKSTDYNPGPSAFSATGTPSPLSPTQLQITNAPPDPHGLLIPPVPGTSAAAATIPSSNSIGSSGASVLGAVGGVGAVSEEDRRARLETMETTAFYKKMMNIAFIVCIASAVFALITLRADAAYVVFILASCAGMCKLLPRVVRWIMVHDSHSSEMRVVSDAIKEGSEGYLATQYTAIAKLACIVAASLAFIYLFRDSPNDEHVSRGVQALTVGFAFLVGAFCSAAAGYIGMWISVRVNIRVAMAAVRGSYVDALQLCFRGGAVSAALSAGLCVVGIAMLYLLAHFIFVICAGLPPQEVPIMLAGYGFGAAFVALFMQLGGGIYTKAADVGADMCGKIEASLPEDDARNPAVVADLVGDNVGDCAGSMADVFESISSEVIGTMILGASLCTDAGIFNSSGYSYIFFPLVVHTFDLLLSGLGILSMGVRMGGATSPQPPQRWDFVGQFMERCRTVISSWKSLKTPSGISSSGSPTGSMGVASPGGRFGSNGYSPIMDSELESGEALMPRREEPVRESELDPLVPMKRGFVFSTAIAIVIFLLTARIMLHTDKAPSAWLHFAFCGLFGIATSYLLILITQYYTDYAFAPVRRIVDASATGHGTNVIAGISVGLESCLFPALVICSSLLVSYNLGYYSGLPAVKAGIFGTAVCTMGMLSTAVYILSMNNFGPIADNAGGIVEMSGQPHAVRVVTDRLDSCGNVTKAASKGYAVGGSALACFVLFQAFLDEVSIALKSSFSNINLARVECVCGAVIGITMIFVFAGWSMESVGRTAQEVVWEVRKQLETRPGIMDGSQRPDYARCVSIVTRAALREMRKPAIMALSTPVLVGILFKMLGWAQGAPQLVLEVLATFMLFATLTGLLMAVFLDNAGGAWDNAKKFIESQGKKGTNEHKAAVTGDTVGDPFKDTAGPSLHVIITSMSTTILVLGPLFVSRVS